MAGHYREPDREQHFLLPVDMADWVDRGDLVHLVLDAVSDMELPAFEAKYPKGGVGAPPFAPRMMVCLLLYAYASGIRSSRKIEKLCRRDAGFRMIVGDEVPDHSVISRFRKRHSKDLAELFAEALRACHGAGLVHFGIVALDGTKVKANASLDANRTSEALKAEVEAMLTEAEQTDAVENKSFAESGDNTRLPEEWRDRSSRLYRLRSCRERLLREVEQQRAKQRAKVDTRAAAEASSEKRNRGRRPKSANDVVAKHAKEAKANVTDPDSRIMKSRNGYLQGYNAQAAVTPSQIIVAADVTNQANDVRQLEPMMDQVRDRMEVVTGDRDAPGVGLFDAGYWSDENAASEPTVSEYLIATAKEWKRRKALRDPEAPRGPIPKGIGARERMERKMKIKRGRALYRMRSQTVETEFGQMKETQGADRFMMRGAEKPEANGTFTAPLTISQNCTRNLPAAYELELNRPFFKVLDRVKAAIPTVLPIMNRIVPESR